MPAIKNFFKAVLSEMLLCEKLDRGRRSGLGNSVSIAKAVFSEMLLCEMLDRGRGSGLGNNV